MFRRWKIDRRFAEIVGGISLLLVAFAADTSFAWLMAVAGIYLLSRQLSTFQSGSTTRRVRRFTGDDRTREDTALIQDHPGSAQIYSHARDAVARAGLDPATVPVLPVDLGLLSFSREDPPAVYRTRAVPDDVDYIQPFVQLRMAMRATGKIRFELVDADGQAVFIHENVYDLSEGLNLVSPPARLPIHDAHALHQDWRLRISADGVLLAEHRFAWTESAEKVIRRHVQVDGELSGEMRQLLDDNRLERMSLDDLLSEHPPEEAQQRAARR